MTTANLNRFYVGEPTRTAPRATPYVHHEPPARYRNLGCPCGSGYKSKRCPLLLMWRMVDARERAAAALPPEKR